MDLICNYNLHHSDVYRFAGVSWTAWVDQVECKATSLLLCSFNPANDGVSWDYLMHIVAKSASDLVEAKRGNCDMYDLGSLEC